MRSSLFVLLRLLGVFVLLSFVGCGEAPPPTTSRVSMMADSDGDGYVSIRHGGRDCLDTDPETNPMTKENPNNKKDDNCNGQEDEFTLKTGHWRLTTNQGKKIDFDVRTDKKTGVQYIRCLQIKFKLESTETKGSYFDYTQWRTGMPADGIKIVNNVFKWVLDEPQETVKITWEGTFTSTTAVKGTILGRDEDPKVKNSEKFTYNGQYLTTPPTDKAAESFCNRCYGESGCPQQQ